MNKSANAPSPPMPIRDAKPMSPTGSSEAWLQGLNAPTLVFYMKPLIQKWLKTFPSPTVLVVCEGLVADLPEQLTQKLKAKDVQWETPAEASRRLSEQSMSVDLLILFQPQMTPEEFFQLAPILKKGGAFVGVTCNIYQHWTAWQTHLEAENISQLFPMGFHPRGAISWWPWLSPPGLDSWANH